MKKMKSYYCIQLFFIAICIACVQCKNENKIVYKGVNCSIYLQAVLDFEEQSYILKHFKDKDGYLRISSKWDNVSVKTRDTIKSNSIRIDTCLKIDIDTIGKKYIIFDNFSTKKMGKNGPYIQFSYPILKDNEIYLQVSYYRFGSSESYIYKLVLVNNKYQIQSRELKWQE